MAAWAFVIAGTGGVAGRGGVVCVFCHGELIRTRPQYTNSATCVSDMTLEKTATLQQCVYQTSGARYYTTILSVVSRDANTTCATASLQCTNSAAAPRAWLPSAWLVVLFLVASTGVQVLL